MIDRGALLLLRDPSGYRGTWRPSLDAHPRAREPALRRLVRGYRDAVVEGDGVLEDLDAALSLLQQSRELGLDELELIVFEAPQPSLPGALPLATEAPAEGLRLAGWDVIELLEPYCSALRDAPNSLQRNEFGLLAERSAAEALARELNAREPDDELHPARIWLIA